MKIWIHINGVQEGPFTPESLPLHRMTPQTPVWYDGLDYWKPASMAPVTSELLRAYYAGESQASPIKDGPDHTVDVDTPDRAETPVDVDGGGSRPYSSGSGFHREGAYSPGSGLQAERAFRQSWKQPEECPPTYLVWSIILTLLCCNPVGIISAVMGWTVTSKFRGNDFEGARRRSETTAWWFIITIVTSLIFTPMYMLVSM